MPEFIGRLSYIAVQSHNIDSAGSSKFRQEEKRGVPNGMPLILLEGDGPEPKELISYGRENRMEKQRLFVDMDGTLAVFTQVDTLETLYEKGYFLNVAPHENVVNAVREIVTGHPEIEVYILSAYLSDSPYALQEKNQWLDTQLPEIRPSHRIFVPCGTDKREGIEGGVRSDDFLLDDYTKNLNDWQPPARGIKLLNGINHTKGSWKHDRLRYDRNPAELAQCIVSVMRDGRRIYDKSGREDRETAGETGKGSVLSRLGRYRDAAPEKRESHKNARLTEER